MSDQKQLRKNTVETLGLLVERYPNLTIGQIICNAVGPLDIFVTDDVAFARALNMLFIHYTQFEAAGIMKQRMEWCRDCAESMFGQCDLHRPR